MQKSFDGKKIMKEVKEIKYLGVIISQYGSNMPDIINKRNKALGTQKAFWRNMTKRNKYLPQDSIPYHS